MSHAFFRRFAARITLSCIAALLLALVVSIGSRVSAAPCGQLLQQLGRDPTENPPTDFQASLPARELDACTDKKLALLQIDPETAKLPQSSWQPQDLNGVWVSDNVLPSYSGATMPAFEVLVIQGNSASGRLTIVQNAMRGVDPWWTPQGRVWDHGHVDVEAVGLTPKIAEAVYVANDVSLEPAVIRYLSPILWDRASDLRIFRHFMAFSTSFPLEATVHGDRLLLKSKVVMGENPERVTYRRRDPRAVRLATLFPWVTDSSALHVPCLIVAFDNNKGRSSVFLGGHSLDELLSVMEQSASLGQQIEDVRRSISEATDQGTGKAKVAEFLDLVSESKKLLATPRMGFIITQAEGGEPFGCADPRG